MRGIEYIRARPENPSPAHMVKKPKDIIDQGSEERALRSDILSDLEPRSYPARLDWLASHIEQTGEYVLHPQKPSETLLMDYGLGRVIEKPYLEGLRALVGQTGSTGSLGDSVSVGQIVAAYVGLINGLENVETQIPPGEVLGRMLVRELHRDSVEARRAVENFTLDAATPRELLLQLATSPDAAGAVDDLISQMDEPTALPEQLGQVQLTTRMWDHQRQGFARWLEAQGEGYVDMATATGKTVLGLAAVGYCTNSGTLHPDDGDWLTDRFDGSPPAVANSRGENVLIVTTDDLLGAQWSRLFEQHCQTPREYTQIVDGSISLPWGDIVIQSAGGLAGLDPTEYQLAIFDEVHNYSRSGGWGDQLARFVESTCPVLALTGSDTRQLSSIADDTVFEKVFEYNHDEALRDGVIPEFDWTLSFVPIEKEASSTIRSLRETAELFTETISAAPGDLSVKTSVRETTGGSASDALSGSYDSLRGMANGLRDAGTDGRAPTADLEALASGLAGRQTHWWNLRPEFEAVQSRAAEAMTAGRPTIILTQSYSESEAITERVQEIGAETIVQLERGADGQTQAEQLEKFDNADEGSKLLIGPGKRIGTGIDIRSVEVGINLARPGTGVSASLVQRLGRLLRNSEGTDSVDFYHVLGLPPTTAIIPPDGRDFVGDVTEFFAQVESPASDGITTLPAVSIAEGIHERVIALETDGAEWYSETEVLDEVSEAYMSQIETSRSVPAVTASWYPSTEPPNQDNDAIAHIAATVVTSDGKQAEGQATLSVVPPTEAGNVTVTVRGENSRGVCSVFGGERAEFDNLTSGEYCIVASWGETVTYADVTLDDTVEPIRL